MWRAWKLGSMFGTGIYIHWSFLLAPVYAFIHESVTSDLATGVFVASIIVCVFACILLHEMGHALAARLFGIGTRDITLYAIGGLARLDRMSEKPHEELVIALAGPAVNVVIAIFFGFVIGVGLLLDPGFVRESLTGRFIFYLAAGNILLVLFNMIPAFPTDGGRVLRSLLAMRLGHLNATRIAAWLGGVFALGFLAFGVVMFHPLIPILAIFLFLAGQQELNLLERRRRPKREAPAAVPETAAAASSPSALPVVTTYIWDADTGQWIKQPNSPFYRSY